MAQEEAAAEISPALLEHCATFDLPGLKGWSIQGHSRAGERTGFWLHPLRIVLDAGVVTHRTATAICLTHSHVDHSWQLPWIFGCRTPKLKGHESLRGRPVLAPKSAWPMMEQLEHACHNLSVGFMENRPDILAEQRLEPIMVQAGDIMEAVPGLKGIQVEMIPCYHPAETVGFGFAEVKDKLKAEYVGLEGREIGKLRKEGAVITAKHIMPRAVFFGDTHIGALQAHDEWEKYPVVILECTVYPEITDKVTGKVYPGLNKTTEETRAMGHIHWDDILPVIKEYPENFFVLIHASMAVRAAALKALEQDTKAGGTENFKIWYEP